MQALIDKGANRNDKNSVGTKPLLLATRIHEYAQEEGDTVLEDKVNTILKILKSPKKEEL